jgi:hypothetical protein
MAKPDPVGVVLHLPFNWNVPPFVMATTPVLAFPAGESIPAPRLPSLVAKPCIIALFRVWQVNVIFHDHEW